MSTETAAGPGASSDGDGGAARSSNGSGRAEGGTRDGRERPGNGHADAESGGRIALAVRPASTDASAPADTPTVTAPPDTTAPDTGTPGTTTPDAGTPGTTAPDTGTPGDRGTPAPSPARTSAEPEPIPAAGGKTTPWGVSLIVLVAGMFMSVLDISIVNVAIPTMQNDFGVTTEDIQWVSTSYSLAEGVIVPASAWLGLRFGLARCYCWALVLFTVGSVMCGLAWDLNSMIAFRILQAVPGGVIPVVALSMLYKVVPKAKIGAAMGMYGLGIIFAPAVGPTLGGYLVEYVDWRLIFFINVPVGIVGVIAAIVYLPSFTTERAHRFDVPGFLAIASGLFALLLALDKGTKWGWTSYPVLILVTYSLLALALFVIIELEVDHPLLDVRVFTSWAFTNSLVIISVISMGLFGVLFFIPQSLQGNQGLGAFETGLVLLPQALVMAVIMPVAGQLYDRIGARWPAVIGLLVCAHGTYLLHDLTVDTPHSHLGWILAYRAGGVALAMMPIMTGGMSSLPPDRVSGASAYNTVVQRASSAIGLAALTALMTGLQAQSFADRSGLLPAGGTSGAASGAGSSSSASGATSGSGSGGGAGGSSVLEKYQTYSQLNTHVFDTAFGNLMIITTGLTLVALVLAFMLPSGKPAAAGGGHSVEM